MPEYFSLELMFTNERIKPDFVKDLYQYFTDAGFNFNGGYRWIGYDGTKVKTNKVKTTINVIADWNQKWMEERLRLDFSKKDVSDDYSYNNDYRQMLFKRKGYSELRCYWTDYNKHPSFKLIIPEYDILFYKNDVHYIQNKFEPIIKLGQKLWEDGKVDVIQTTLETDDPLYGFSDILEGKNIWFRPFAIIPENMFVKFPREYFANAQVTNLANNGVYIERTDQMVP